MKTSFLRFWRPRGLVLIALSVWFATSVLHAAYTQLLHTPAAGDAQYSWNSRYAGEGYEGVGELAVGAATSFYSGIPSDTQYTVGILMVPLASLQGGELFSAHLTVNVLGFSTWYYYGSAALGRLSVADTMALTGDVVADGLGPLAKARPTGYTVFDSGIGGSGAAGLMSFDVTSAVSTDLAAGHAYSIFVLTTSRDTAGSISSAESGNGAFLTAVTSIPEPVSAGLWAGVLACGLAGGSRRRRAARA